MSVVKSIYLYSAPFVVVSPRTLQQTDYILSDTRFESATISEEQRYIDILRKFMIDNGLVKTTADRYGTGTGITHSLETNMSSWIWHVNWGNMRRLVEKAYYVQIIDSLKNYDNEGLDLIVNLHTRLGIIFDEVFLNTIINRTMNAIQVIPFALDEKQPAVDWKTIHIETPYLWILIQMQTLLLTEGIPLEKLNPK